MSWTSPSAWLIVVFRALIVNTRHPTMHNKRCTFGDGFIIIVVILLLLVVAVVLLFVSVFICYCKIKREILEDVISKTTNKNKHVLTTHPNVTTAAMVLSLQ